MRVIIFANGVLTNYESARQNITPSDFVIAADGGLLHCKKLGLTPSVLIGDFDSLSPAEIDQMEKQGATLIKYPSQKDETDLELALRCAVQKHPERILIYGALGARWDQTLANLLMPALAGFHEQEIILLDDNQELTVLNAPRRTLIHLTGQAGDTVSLIPILGDVHGVRTSGLEYPLQDETLIFGATRGISNLLLENDAKVEIRSGSLMVVLIHHQNRASSS